MTGDLQSKNAYLSKGDAGVAAARSATWPHAVEATLSRISDEMMQEAIERRERPLAAGSPLAPKTD